MTPRSRVRLVAFRPASRQAVPNVAATLGPVHRRWMTETMHGIASALRPDADFWSGWSAVRFLHDRFDEQYRWQSVVVAAIMPLLPPADARRLRAITVALEEVRYDLDRVGRWQNMTAVTGALAYRFLKLLRAWFREIQRVTQGFTEAELSPEGRHAMAQLEAASPKLRRRRV